MQMRFHILGIQHTATNKRYSGCAFTQKVLNLCKLLKMQGHYVIHYGNELSEVDCDEHVSIIPAGMELAPEDALKYDTNSELYRLFNTNAIAAIAERKQRNDFLLCPWAAHNIVAAAFPDLIVVESGIGYAYGTFAPYKVFESYAILHAYYGLEAVKTANKFEWYARVIPNYFDTADFTYNDGPREDYLMFLGMRHGGTGKGYSVAVDAAKDAGIKLVVAGPDAPINAPEHVEYVGLLGVQDRAKYLANARALIAPSLFLEPFCGAHIEAFFSGTPVISTDWGAFAEYNLQGKTGYRCRTHAEFVTAIDKVRRIDPIICRKHAEQFTLENVGLLYTQYFEDLMKIYTGKGWYQL